MMKQRYEGRGAWEDAKLDYSILTNANLRMLINFINYEMAISGRIRRTLRMRRLLNLHRRDGKIVQAHLRCMSFYFKDREAVTFAPDGNIGFAGWAEDETVQPILTGFIRWVRAISPNP